MNPNIIPSDWAILDLRYLGPQDLLGLPLGDGTTAYPKWMEAPAAVFTHWHDSLPDTRAAALTVASNRGNIFILP